MTPVCPRSLLLRRHLLLVSSSAINPSLPPPCPSSTVDLVTNAVVNFLVNQYSFVLAGRDVSASPPFA